MLHKYFPSQFIWEVFFHARISSQPLFHLKNPAMQDFYRSFNRDCELVSQLPTLSYFKAHTFQKILQKIVFKKIQSFWAITMEFFPVWPNVISFFLWKQDRICKNSS